MSPRSSCAIPVARLRKALRQRARQAGLWTCGYPEDSIAGHGVQLTNKGDLEMSFRTIAVVLLTASLALMVGCRTATLMDVKTKSRKPSYVRVHASDGG